MKIVFKKRRYYKGKFRNPGEAVDVDPKYARAFIRVNAAVPASQAPAKKKTKLARTTQVTTPPVDVEVEPVVDEQLPEDLPELEGVQDDDAYLTELSYRELQDLCKEKGLSAKGSAAELVERLRSR